MRNQHRHLKKIGTVATKARAIATHYCCPLATRKPFDEYLLSLYLSRLRFADWPLYHFLSFYTYMKYRLNVYENLVSTKKANPHI